MCTSLLKLKSRYISSTFFNFLISTVYCFRWSGLFQSLRIQWRKFCNKALELGSIIMKHIFLISFSLTVYLYPVEWLKIIYVFLIHQNVTPCTFSWSIKADRTSFEKWYDEVIGVAPLFGRFNLCHRRMVVHSKSPSREECCIPSIIIFLSLANTYWVSQTLVEIA